MSYTIDKRYNEIMMYNNKKINRLIPKLIFVALLIIVFLISFYAVNVFNKKREVEAEIKKLKNENISLEEKKSELGNLLDYFQDKSFIEKEARRRLNLQKFGEKAVIIVDKREEEDMSASATESSEKLMNNSGSLINPRKWLNFIFKFE
ncbi:MAG: Septum formation initiator [Parcubacteria group bacterium GW2011_GWC1_38_17]|nr:MAG: Septum formation initiator [Parcubacteria group bacterium GW2011_GWC2_36_17]KKQ58192.1 MAG: Septum formation initiator [Parcubacteria group bacterium GW2011_GWC1_38_17]